jgi:histidyl-tRNA synthetase
MAKLKKQPRPKAETPKGFRDYFGYELIQRQRLLNDISEVYQLYGFSALESSAVETVEALGKFLPDIDRPNEGVFAWEEDDTWLALRYDLTAPLARVYAQFRNDLPNPYRRYSMGPVWRNEKPGLGRYRQFYQCDADTVGSSNLAADVEICTLLCDALEAAGINRGDYIVKVNNRKILNGVMEVAGLLKSNDFDYKIHERGIVLRAIDKLDRLGFRNISELLGNGRKDDSGDFTKGANLSEEQIKIILSFVQYKGSTGAKTIGNLTDLVKGSAVGLVGVNELETILELNESQGYMSDRVYLDPSVVRGLGYYTGPVYEAELTFQVLDENGSKRSFGSVAGGGRYDDLIKRFTGQEVPATGISIGVDRIMAALAANDDQSTSPIGPVVVTVMDKSMLASYQNIASELRSAGIPAEVYMGNPKNFGNQLKYADKRNSPIAIIEGSEEAGKGVIQLKDLLLGSEIAKGATLEQWKSQPAQTEVLRDNLVAEVCKILNRDR